MATSSSASDIKSTAVVKYSSVKWPVQFSTIRLNTDLNHPPSDQTGFTVYYDGSMPASHNFSQFLSVNMAHSNQDLVGQVDVISSSKSIKALLKMPFSSSPHISIMVHRLGKTLLLEDFDVVKHIIRKQAEEWSWLRNYFYDVIAKEEEEKKSKFLDGTPANRESMLNHMYMNLIRHSFAASENGEACTAVTATDDSQPVNPFENLTCQDLRGFHHETLWKFQDISMLIDSDLPIFGGGSSRRPCISLRLRDSRSPPINVLTGLDYWLDNLMSNVPEVAMCYHINGFVQKYEVMKTEDIPNLDNSSFDPNEVLDIAQNIMSFIKRNAAVEGHTYWLYKSENDEMVKLYDLTDLCKDKIVTGENPFTVPVGLLCHRVALNIRTSGQRRHADSRAMFENCLRLLDDTKYCQECAEAHFHLSDMWVPNKSMNDIWQDKKIPAPPTDLYDEQSTDSDDGSQGEENINLKCKGAESENKMQPASSDSPNEKEVNNSVALKELVVRGMVKKKAWQTVQANRIAGTTDERCKQALTHIRKGLNCIDRDLIREKNESDVVKEQPHSPVKVIPLPYAPLNINTKDNPHKVATPSDAEEQEPKMCSPWTAIPLPYKSKSEENNSYTKKAPKAKKSPTLNSSISEERARSSSATDHSTQQESWHTRVKLQLLRKAAVTYFVLAKEFFEIKKFGHTLRHLRYAIHCFEAFELLDSSVCKEHDDVELYTLILFLAAQTRNALYSNFPGGRHDFEELGEEEAAILHSAQAVLATPRMSWVYEWSPNLQANMTTAFNIFENLTHPAVVNKNKFFQTALKKNFAACLMNLGHLQMEICKEKILKNDATWEKAKPFIGEAKDSFTRSKRLFESLGDKNNAGYICSNMAYLHILAAAAIHHHLPADVILPLVERQQLLKAIEWYEKCAKNYLNEEGMDQHREMAYQSISSQYHQMANQYFVKNPDDLTDAEVERLREYLQKSLKFCFLDSHGPYLKKYRSVAANGNVNLARVCEVEWSRTTNATRKRQLKQKSWDHYQKAIELYKLLNWPRTHMCIAITWMKGLLQESERSRGSMASSTRKKIFINVLNTGADVKSAIDTMWSGHVDEEDNPSLLTTDYQIIEDLLALMNRAFTELVRQNVSNVQLKDFYRRCLTMTQKNILNQLYPELSTFLDDLRSALASNLVH